jgi:hypothetical protein
MKTTKPILASAQDAMDAMRELYDASPAWFAGNSLPAAQRLVRLVQARYEIGNNIEDLLTTARLREIAEITLDHARRYISKKRRAPGE